MWNELPKWNIPALETARQSNIDWHKEMAKDPKALNKVVNMYKDQIKSLESSIQTKRYWIEFMEEEASNADLSI